jgi:hypothetical protein
VQYFSRQSEKILSVDDALHDAVMNPQFAINAPDWIAVELYFQNKLVKVSLSSLNRESRFAK